MYKRLSMQSKRMFAEVEEDVSDDEKTRKKKRSKKPSVSATTRSPRDERDGLSSGDESPSEVSNDAVYVCVLCANDCV